MTKSSTAVAEQLQSSPTVSLASRVAIGQRFGRLVVDALARKGRYLRATVRCDCGHAKEVEVGNLVHGRSTSCGCRNREVASARLKTHGMRRSSEYRVWTGMRTRCSNPRASNFQRYGGRGITVCARWREDFAAFLADVGPRPSPEHTLDRIDPLGNYEPGNVRWATETEQANNKRSNHMLTFRGETTSIAEWARKTGLSRDSLKQRIRAGWPVDRALTEGPDPRRSRPST